MFIAGGEAELFIAGVVYGCLFGERVISPHTRALKLLSKINVFHYHDYGTQRVYYIWLFQF